MKVTALLTGRGNNTLPDKNVREILGHPVLHYPALAGREAKEVSAWYCSSDDEKILEAAEKEGYKRIVRPEELARPDSQHIDCIMHALGIMEQQGDLPDVLVVLLANNVTVYSQWIDDCVQLLKQHPEASFHQPTGSSQMHVFGAQFLGPSYQRDPGTGWTAAVDLYGRHNFALYDRSVYRYS